MPRQRRMIAAEAEDDVEDFDATLRPQLLEPLEFFVVVRQSGRWCGRSATFPPAPTIGRTGRAIDPAARDGRRDRINLYHQHAWK